MKPKISNPFVRWGLVAVITAAVAGTVYYSRHSILAAFNPAYALTIANLEEVQKIHERCLRGADHECLVAAYQRMIQNDPNDVSAKANLAFQLTTLKRFTDADPIYREILASGTGTYDLMAFHAVNLTGLGQRLDAIKWFEKSLGINPNLVDATQKLASLYVQEKRPAEAISLLQSFIYRFPSAAGSLSGDLSADLELFERAKPVERIRLVGFSDGHFALPLQLRENKTAELFMVDTGASVVSMPKSDIEKYWPELLKKSRPTQFSLADGSKIEAQVATLPLVKIGSWDFKNIEVAFCDSCARLAGMSLLKKLKMETSSDGELSTLTLSR